MITGLFMQNFEKMKQLSAMIQISKTYTVYFWRINSLGKVSRAKKLKAFFVQIKIQDWEIEIGETAYWFSYDFI